jgi:hypothetical protein
MSRLLQHDREVHIVVKVETVARRLEGRQARSGCRSNLLGAPWRQRPASTSRGKFDIFGSRAMHEISVLMRWAPERSSCLRLWSQSMRAQSKHHEACSAMAFPSGDANIEDLTSPRDR